MSDFPLVTLGIANFNYARFVTQALDSAAKQTYGNCELIIVDDCSKDDSIEVIQKWIDNYTGNFKITFIKNSKNSGVANVCSSILERASGKYYQILDADDGILPSKIATQVAILEKEERSALVYSNISVINENDETIEEDYLKRIGYNQNKMPVGNVFNELLIFNFIPNSSVLIRTGFAKQIGGYSQTFQIQDYYLYLTLSEHFPFSYCNCISGFYRVHSTSLSNNLQSNAKSIEGSLKLQFLNYSKGNKKAKANLRKSIFNMAPYFYKHNYSTTAYWLKKNVQFNPGLKSIGYFTAFTLGVPYSFFDNFKSLFLKKVLN
jgi:glycosyltransferase involved in cell wall biosynthesis